MPAPTAPAKTGPEITERPMGLPPALDGEDEVDQELIALIRDGSRSLEDEDFLVKEIIDIYRAYKAWDEPVWWTPPIPEGENIAMGDERLIGYELKFNAITGSPVAFTLVSAMDHKEPLFTKRVPDRSWPVLRYPCPLSAESPRAGEHRTFGFGICRMDKFVNYALWAKHVTQDHATFMQSQEAIAKEGERPLARMWEEAMEQSEKLIKARRASDPRLARETVAA